MSTSSSAQVRAIVASRLRAAGCVYAEEEADMLVDVSSTQSELDRLIAQRESGMPLEYVVGWAEFCGLQITVTPGVFVPRRRTEYLVSQAIKLLPPDGVVVDLCCGSGAVAAALMAAVPNLTVVATDIDPMATDCAAANLGTRARVYTGDLFDALPEELRGRVDVVVANTPYVPSQEITLMPAEARLFESPVSLDGGADGLDLQRRVAADAGAWLAPGGHLLVETSARQASTVADFFAANGLEPRICHSHKRAATVVTGTWPLNR